jgi:hypothetical protein
MADEKVPTPQTAEELTAYIQSLVDGGKGAAGEDGYQYTADATGKAAVAAFNYVAHVFGITGFQAGWASMQFLREVRHLDGPFGIVDGNKLLYPQYNLVEQVQEWVTEWTPQLAPKAKEKLAEAERNNFKLVHPNVLAHWRKLAAMES